VLFGKPQFTFPELKGRAISDRHHIKFRFDPSKQQQPLSNFESRSVRVLQQTARPPFISATKRA
jgi:hypothetical protein